MNGKRILILSANVAILMALAVTVHAQVHKYYSPGSARSVTMIRVHPGMDQTHLDFLDTQWKRKSDLMVESGFMKAY